MLALPAGGGYDYRGTVSVWFRGLFALGPRPEVIADAPLLFRPHAPSACPLFAARPFTRLVHVWSAPVGYLVRPCSVHRRRATPARASRTRSTTGRWSGDDDGLGGVVWIRPAAADGALWPTRAGSGACSCKAE
ncbi:respiratory nitrate reductase subunit gamma, partial [Streptomyces anthocyanicus]|uniref:respiratory nitrate reductase subunit gamma n=1 Tax=Streptomyces anthocyanicus TaxID=68174 RepID=UPI003666225B